MDDTYYMSEALKEAREAFKKGEVPVGAVIVRDNKIIAKAHNQIEMLRDATAHAEIICITQAENASGSWRLNNTVIYVTKEPCPMCAGAMVNSRIKKLVYGAYDKDTGCAGSVMNIADNKSLRHRLEVKGGVNEKECREILQDFFKIQRQAGKSAYN